MNLRVSSDNLPTTTLRHIKLKPGEEPVGLMAGGGPCNGVDEVAWSILHTSRNRAQRVLGFPNSWDTFSPAGFHLDMPVIDFDAIELQKLHEMLVGHPGTSIGTSRTMVTPENFHYGSALRDILRLKGMIAIGGDGTSRGAQNFHYLDLLRFLITPKTVDNDMEGSDFTFGYMTGCERGAEALFSMMGEVKKPGGIGVVQLYGRNNGRLTVDSAALVNDDIICLVPEVPISRERFLSVVAQRIAATTKENQPGHVVIALSEGFSFENETQCTTGQTDGANNLKLDGASDMLAECLAGGGYKKIRTQKPENILRSSRIISHDSQICEGLGERAAYLARENVWGQALSLKAQYNESSFDLTMVHRPLWEVAEGNFLPREEYDIDNLRLHDVPRARVDFAHRSRLCLHQDNAAYDSLREDDKNIVKLVAADVHRMSIGGGIYLPQGVRDPRESDTSEVVTWKYPTRWREYILNLTAQK